MPRPCAANCARRPLDYASRGFAAWADHADGMLAVAQGRGDRACAALRSAIGAFRRDRQPYETAQALRWMSRARLLTNEPELAEHDLAESRAILQRLGATTEVRGTAPTRHRTAHGPRSRGPRVRRGGRRQSRSGRAAVHQREDRRAPPRERLPEARRQLSHRRSRVVARPADADPRLTVCIVRCRRSRRIAWIARRDAASADRSFLIRATGLHQ